MRQKLNEPAILNQSEARAIWNAVSELANVSGWQFSCRLPGKKTVKEQGDTICITGSGYYYKEVFASWMEFEAYYGLGVVQPSAGVAA